MPAMASLCRACLLMILALTAAHAQAPAETREDEAVGDSINYVFATDLGSGLYDLGGRSLQIYRYVYRHDLRETRPAQAGIRFVLPVTAGFFDFNPVDVISSGPPTRVDSFSVVPGLELDYLLRDGWHLLPYARAGFSIASSSVDGWLYGAGVRLERRVDYTKWEGLWRTDLAYAGVKYRSDTPGDQFLRLREGVDFTRTLRLRVRSHPVEIGIYGIYDLIVDPPTAPVAGADRQPLQMELGMTIATRPRLKIWKFDAPRLGVGYRFAGDLSAWRLVFGAPF